MDDSLIERLYRAVGLLRVHQRASFWLADVVALLPASIFTDFAKLDAEIGVDSGAFRTEDDALIRRFGSADMADVTKDGVVEIVHEWVGSEAYYRDAEDYPGPLTERVKAALGDPLSNPFTCAHLLSRETFVHASSDYLASYCDELTSELAGQGVFEHTESPKSKDARRHWKLILSFFAHSTPSPDRTMLQWYRQDFDYLFRHLAIERRHPLQTTKYALVPCESRVAIASAIDQIILEAANDPELIRRLCG